MQRQLKDQLAQQPILQAPTKAEKPDYGPELLERMVRVEEELKHQRELLKNLYAANGQAL